MTSDSLLVHYDPTNELTIMCDASPFGVGAALSQIDKQEVEKPVAYPSHTLSSAERSYSQLELVDILLSKNQALSVLNYC